MSSTRWCWLLVFCLLVGACTAAEDPESSSDDVADEVTETTADNVGTDDDGDVDGDEEAGTSDGETWTFMLYSLSDTDLEPFMLQDVAEMAAVGSSDAVNMVALVDRAEGHSEDPLLNAGVWESGKLFHVLPEELVELEDLGEPNLGDPAVLAGFIETAITNFPADRYALTISDHGGGWTGIGSDDSSGDVLELPELVSGIGDGLAAAGVERLDLVGYDACLMATYEVASAMAPLADHMVASEELEPGIGWDYTVLQRLVDDPAMDAVALGTAIVDGFAAHAEDFDVAADITLSLVDLAQLPTLDQALADLAAVLGEQAAALGPVIGREVAEGVGYGRDPDPQADFHLTDLGAFVSEIGVESLQVSDSADAVLRAINDAVLHQTVGPARLGSTGLSIYLPPVAELVRPGYDATPAAATWAQFLAAYHGAGQAIPAEEQPALVEPDPEGAVVGDGEATVTEVEDGVEVSIQLDPATVGNVATATLNYGYVDPEDGALVQLGDTEAEVFDDGTVAGFTDLTVLTVSDGQDTVDAYLGLEFDEEAGLANATVPFDYEDPATGELLAVDLSLVMDAETLEIIQEVYYLVDEEEFTAGQLTPDPNALITPVVLVYLPDGTVEWQTFGDTALFADLPALQYELAPLEPGTEVYVDITVTDFGGNEVIGSATFVLE